MPRCSYSYMGIVPSPVQRHQLVWSNTSYSYMGIVPTPNCTPPRNPMRQTSYSYRAYCSQSQKNEDVSLDPSS